MKLDVQIRNIVGKAVKRIRKNGNLPGVIYGKHIENPINVMFNKNEFLKVFKDAGESTPVDLIGDGINQLVLVHDIEKDSVTDEVIHVDFLAVSADEKVKAEVVIVLIGESVVEKEKLGKIELIKTHVLVEALPKDLPHDIKVDISNIKSVNDVIFVRDLNVSNAVVIKEDPNLAVVTVISAKDLEQEEVVEESTVSDSSKNIVEEGKQEQQPSGTENKGS